MSINQEIWPEPPPGPFEGVPEWLINSLRDWLADVFTGDSGYAERRRILAVIRHRRLRLPSVTSWRELDRTIVDAWNNNEGDELLLDLVDSTLAENSDNLRAAMDLHAILEGAGSAWKVYKTDGRMRLVRRLDATTQDVIARASEQDTKPSAFLRMAFVQVYGRDPQPGTAYRNVMKAVEAAADPVVLTDSDSHRTLGKIISDLEAKPSKWKFAISAIAPETDEDQFKRVIEMLRVLWKSDPRHASQATDERMDVSTVEAEAALHLAATLVHWFSSGAIVRQFGPSSRDAERQG